MRRLAALGIAAIIAALSGGSAAAKGGGLTLDDYVQPGQTVHATSALSSRWKDRLRERVGDRPLYAYASRWDGRQLDQVPPLPDGARVLGRIEVEGYKKSGRWWWVKYGIKFTMPELQPGRYRLDVCAKPCKHAVEELYPSVFRLVAGPLEERLQKQVDRISARASVNAYNARQSAHRARRAQRDARSARALASDQLAGQGARIDDMEAALKRLRTESNKGAPLQGMAIAFAAGCGLVLVARRVHHERGS